MKRILTDPRYGFHVSIGATARAFGFDRKNLIHKSRGRQWIYPGEVSRILTISKKIREGRLKLKCTREYCGRKIYDAVVVDPPEPPYPETQVQVRVDFRGVKVGIIPAAPPARRFPSPEGVFGRATFWAPRR